MLLNRCVKFSSRQYRKDGTCVFYDSCVMKGIVREGDECPSGAHAIDLELETPPSASEISPMRVRVHVTKRARYPPEYGQIWDKKAGRSVEIYFWQSARERGWGPDSSVRSPINVDYEKWFVNYEEYWDFKKGLRKGKGKYEAMRDAG